MASGMSQGCLPESMSIQRALATGPFAVGGWWLDGKAAAIIG